MKTMYQGFWAEAINIACYIIDRVYVKPCTKTNPFEIWKVNTLKLSYFHVFGFVCYILKDNDHLQKFDLQSDERIFLGYATHSIALCVYNKRTRMIIEFINKVFDDKNITSIFFLSIYSDSPTTNIRA